MDSIWGISQKIHSSTREMCGWHFLMLLKSLRKATKKKILYEDTFLYLFSSHFIRTNLSSKEERTQKTFLYSIWKQIKFNKKVQEHFAKIPKITSWYMSFLLLGNVGKRITVTRFNALLSIHFNKLLVRVLSDMIRFVVPSNWFNRNFSIGREIQAIKKPRKLKASHNRH